MPITVTVYLGDVSTSTTQRSSRSWSSCRSYSAATYRCSLDFASREKGVDRTIMWTLYFTEPKLFLVDLFGTAGECSSQCGTGSRVHDLRSRRRKQKGSFFNNLAPPCINYCSRFQKLQVRPTLFERTTSRVCKQRLLIFRRSLQPAMLHLQPLSKKRMRPV